MLRRYLLGGLTVGLLASVLLAKQGTVTTRQGDTFTGDVTLDDTNVYVNGPGGQLSFKKANIAKVEYVDTIDDQYDSRHAALKPKDVQGRIDLAAWANDNRRADLAVKVLQEARAIDPSNKDAATALDAAEQQVALDQAAPTAKPPAATTPPPASPGIAAAPATAPAPVAKGAAPRRLLNEDEINTIREREMSADDAKLKVKFSNNLIKRYLSTGGKDAATFNTLLPAEQAIDILGVGDPAMSKDIKILNDPVPLLQFKQKIAPLVATGCASVACHGGNKAGAFSLFSGESTNAVYTNFYILQTYSVTIDKKKYLLMDREIPEQSLVLLYGLPMNVAVPAHPKVPNWRPRFRSADDAGYKQITDWLSNSLKVVQPDYGLNVDVKLQAPLMRARPPQPMTPTTENSPQK